MNILSQNAAASIYQMGLRVLARKLPTHPAPESQPGHSRLPRRHSKIFPNEQMVLPIDVGRAVVGVEEILETTGLEPFARRIISGRLSGQGGDERLDGHVPQKRLRETMARSLGMPLWKEYTDSSEYMNWAIGLSRSRRGQTVEKDAFGLTTNGAIQFFADATQFCTV